jgi:group II intron reverse transcriptase/maturase
MQDAETVLSIIRDRGRRRLPLAGVYRQLYNPALYLLAYGNIHGNAGATTPGTTEETVDGMSREKIGRIVELVRTERYRFTPVRRVYIEKKGSTKKRPLGIPTWSDKLVQEVMRLLLEAYYEPRFSDRSHGFRANRGCHTALNEVHRWWRGTTWFIEGDIKGCFDNLDHGVLLDILRCDIRDNRFLRFVEGLLKAGYLEDWTYHRTHSGSPQGGVVSPILANIYLDRLDQFVENALVPEYTRGSERKRNPEYRRVQEAATKAKARGDLERAEALRKQQRQTPSKDTHDPNYRRLRYVRYADDFLLGFAGPKEEAEAIKRRIGDFLRDDLKLELSEDKTLVTHGRTGSARFLGYDLVVNHDDTRLTRQRNGKVMRIISSGIGLKVPRDVVAAKVRRYTKNGKAIPRFELLNNDPYTVVAGYAREYRGFVQYYRMAQNLRTLSRLRWVMEQSLAKTLAQKLNVSVAHIHRRYGQTVQTPTGPRKTIRVTVGREGAQPLVATWGTTPLVRNTNVVLDDATPGPFGHERNEIVTRLLADTCELCGSREDVEVHHIRALKDLNKPGRREKPFWQRVMAARNRKTLVVCRACHLAIHNGRPPQTTKTTTESWRAG